MLHDRKNATSEVNDLVAELECLADTELEGADHERLLLAAQWCLKTAMALAGVVAEETGDETAKRTWIANVKMLATSEYEYLGRSFSIDDWIMALSDEDEEEGLEPCDED